MTNRMIAWIEILIAGVVLGGAWGYWGFEVVVIAGLTIIIIDLARLRHKLD